MPEHSYPPQFSTSAVSSTIGQINDFAGNSSSSSARMLKSAAAPNTEAARKAMADLANLGESVPVVITGSRPQKPVHFPGLRETMIGAAIVQLADEIPEDNPLREKIRELALDLHALGAEKIVRNRKSGAAKSRSRKTV